MTTPLEAPPQPKKKARGVAMTDLQYKGLSLLAGREGHLSRSHVIQRLLNTELKRQLGSDWEQVVEADDATERDVA